MFFFFAAIDCICDSQIFTRMVLQFYICINLHYNFVTQTWHNDIDNRVSSKINKLIMWIEKVNSLHFCREDQLTKGKKKWRKKWWVYE